MGLTKWARPAEVVLPGGFRIKAVYWSGKKIKAGLSGDESLHGKDLLGFWDIGAKHIVINRDEPLWVQAETFGHEMIHAVNDYHHWLTQNVVEPIKQEAVRTMQDELEEE